MTGWDVERERRTILGAVGLEPYEARVVRPHERTHAGPKEDRLRLIRAVRTNISPVFGLYPDPEGAAWAAIAPEGPPDGEATGFDGLMAAEDLLDGAEAEDWRRAVTLLETVEATELVGPHVGAEELLLRLFHEEDPRVFATQPVRFGCTCGPEKVVQSLSGYPARDIAGMTTPEGKVTADCQFCGAHYEFDPSELGMEAGGRGA